MDMWISVHLKQNDYDGFPKFNFLADPLMRTPVHAPFFYPASELHRGCRDFLVPFPVRIPIIHLRLRFGRSAKLHVATLVTRSRKSVSLIQIGGVFFMTGDRGSKTDERSLSPVFRLLSPVFFILMIYWSLITISYFFLFRRESVIRTGTRTRRKKPPINRINWVVSIWFSFAMTDRGNEMESLLLKSYHNIDSTREKRKKTGNSRLRWSCMPCDEVEWVTASKWIFSIKINF